MPKIAKEDIVIRIIQEKDLNSIVEIDSKISGIRRNEYYERKIVQAIDKQSSLGISLVAEIKGRIVGFIMGELYLGEFGIPETTASLDTIGIDPDYQKQGVAQTLLDEFKTLSRKAGVETIYTRVKWNDWNLLRFFEVAGFLPAQTLNLELRIK